MSIWQCAPSKKGISSSRVRSGPSARAMVESLRIAFRRRRTSSCYIRMSVSKLSYDGTAHRACHFCLVSSYLQLIDENGDRVQLVALVLSLHDVYGSRAVVRRAKEWMAVVQDLRGLSCFHSLRGREAAARERSTTSLLTERGICGQAAVLARCSCCRWTE